MKVLNLYAGIGGNRKLWENCEVTSVENVDYIADAYETMFPQDELIRTDAHQYLLAHFQEYDFIWSSPPCPTHSKLRMSHPESRYYPDMKLYEEIIFLQNFYKGNWCVENVESYYDPLIRPTAVLDRHYFWTNYPLNPYIINKNDRDVSRATKEQLADHLGIKLPVGTKDVRKLLRNAVHPALGLHIYQGQPLQQELFQGEQQ